MIEPARRILLRRIFQIGVTVTVLPTALNAVAADSCVSPDSDGLRTSLHYANASPKKDELCKACSFFAADPAKTACGNCQIMSGPVDAAGHCDSWAKA
jgi:High potential iron-sulfur protein